LARNIALQPVYMIPAASFSAILFLFFPPRFS